MENSSEFYYEKLRTANNPGVILATFYCSLYNREVSRSEIMMFNKLLNVFHRFTIHFAILETVKSHPEVLETPYPYLFEICKRKFEASHQDTSIQARESLDKFIESIDAEIEKIEKLNSKSKIKIPSSEGLE